MNRLGKVLAAMEAADAQLFDEAIAEGRDVTDAAIATGYGALEITCQAWDLDFEQVAVMAARRSLQTVDVMTTVNEVTLPGALREFIASMCAGALLTGLRVGLLVADDVNREGSGT